MATVVKRGDKQFQATIRRKGLGTQCRTFETKQAAKAWARGVEAKIDSGEFVCSKEARNTLLRDALTRYAEEITATKKGATQELARIKRWKRSPLADRSLASIGGKDLADYQKQRLNQDVEARQTGDKHKRRKAATAAAAPDTVAAASNAKKPARKVGPNTVRLELAIISHLYTVARKDWGMSTLKNPVKDMRRVKPAKARDRRLKDGEQAALLKVAEHSQAAPWLGLTIRLALATGMRANELLTLQWAQVDSLIREIRLDATKNGDDRAIPMTDEALQVVDELRAVCKPARAKEANAAADSPGASGDTPADSSGDELPLNSRVILAFGATSNLDHAFARACLRAGIAGLHFHDLRHEAASIFAPFLQVHELAKVMGWRTLQMAMRYYHPRTAELLNKLASAAEAAEQGAPAAAAREREVPRRQRVCRSVDGSPDNRAVPPANAERSKARARPARCKNELENVRTRDQVRFAELTP